MASPLDPSADASGRPRRRRRTTRSLVAALLAAGLLAWWLWPVAPPEPRGEVSFATGVRTGVYERYGGLLKQRLDDELPKVELELQNSQGSVHNVQRVASGQTDFTIAAADAVADYVDRGGRGGRDLRACARLYDDYIQLIVPADSRVRRAGDLKGLRVAAGEERSGVNLVAGRLLEAAGLDPEHDLTMVRAGIDRMPKLLAERKLDAFFWSGGLPTTAVQRLAERTDIRLVQLGDLVPRLHRQQPETRYYRSAVMPPDAYPGVQNGEAIKTVAVANLLVTRESTDRATTEGITRSVIRNRDAIGREVHAAQKVDLRTAIYTDPLPLHRGAEQYYRSAKP
ncbi:TAXI family TRAP transporter solute-binding subunit [Streptomyces sp. AJS327]|uniref:TAXI family TRAP transporter solute-binding subunit n=1 Tax=Streptomyces sp. AJS327 TaxID=2545265 RepID=UPI0015DEE2A6|nr:TAXI family TRAP transporter solute-binding subunit [Streptomyces sp. AJS327]MBA0051931.1 TAXI family TRAP transporter solute-binding subunit [Streptomyces sp. AJS327]